jgi:flagellar assembly factor FliW
MTTSGTATLHSEQDQAHTRELPADIPVLEMVRPMVGFPGSRRFALARLDETGVICDLRSMDDPDLSFVVVPPGVFFDDYAPELDDTVVAELEIESERDVLTLVVLTLAGTVEGATANLGAPVLVNHRTRRAAQVLLDDPALPLRAPLAPAGRSAG